MKIIHIEIFGAAEDQGVVTYDNGFEEMIEAVKVKEFICDCYFFTRDRGCHFCNSTNTIQFEKAKCSSNIRLDKTDIHWKAIV